MMYILPLPLKQFRKTVKNIGISNSQKEKKRLFERFSSTEKNKCPFKLYADSVNFLSKSWKYRYLINSASKGRVGYEEKFRENFHSVFGTEGYNEILNLIKDPTGQNRFKSDFKMCLNTFCMCKQFKGISDSIIIFNDLQIDELCGEITATKEVEGYSFCPDISPFSENEHNELKSLMKRIEEMFMSKSENQMAKDKEIEEIKGLYVDYCNTINLKNELRNDLWCLLWTIYYGNVDTSFTFLEKIFNNYGAFFEFLYDIYPTVKKVTANAGFYKFIVSVCRHEYKVEQIVAKKNRYIQQTLRAFLSNSGLAELITITPNNILDSYTSEISGSGFYQIKESDKAVLKHNNNYYYTVIAQPTLKNVPCMMPINQQTTQTQQITKPQPPHDASNSNISPTSAGNVSVVAEITVSSPTETVIETVQKNAESTKPRREALDEQTNFSDFIKELGELIHKIENNNNKEPQNPTISNLRKIMSAFKKIENITIDDGDERNWWNNNSASHMLLLEDCEKFVERLSYDSEIGNKMTSFKTRLSSEWKKAVEWLKNHNISRVGEIGDMAPTSREEMVSWTLSNSGKRLANEADGANKNQIYNVIRHGIKIGDVIIEKPKVDVYE